MPDELLRVALEGNSMVVWHRINLFNQNNGRDAAAARHQWREKLPAQSNAKQRRLVLWATHSP